MSVLVTGGAGYIGSHMVLELIDAGEAVVVVDNLSTGFRWAVPDAAQLVVGDAGDQALLTRLIRQHKVDAILHFAGSIVVPDSILDPLAYYRNNTVTSHALIECAIANGVRSFIFSSTAAVYGMPDSNPVFEDVHLEPISPYGSSKMMTEIMLRDASEAHDFRYVALRYFNVAGADPQGRGGQSTPRATHLIKLACQTALGQRPYLEVFGTDYPTPDGTCIRDYIHVTDLVRAHLAALAYLRAGGGSQVLNCGYGSGYSVLEVIDAVKRVSGAKLDVRLAGRRLGDPAALIAGAERIRDVLHWQPQLDDLDTIVLHALGWEEALCGSRLTSTRSHTAAIADDAPRNSALKSLLAQVRVVPNNMAKQRLLDEISTIGHPVVVSFLNAHAINLCWSDALLRGAFANSDILLRDGAGMEMVMPLFGLQSGCNMNGTDFIPSILQRFEDRPVALFGTRLPWLQIAADNINRAGGRVVCIQDGFQDSLVYEELARRHRPALIILAMGMPKQEYVSQRLKATLSHPALIVNGGAILDFLANRVTRAPRPMRALRLEWTYRLLMEPRRMFARYVLGNPLFLYRCLRLAATK